MFYLFFHNWNKSNARTTNMQEDILEYLVSVARFISFLIFIPNRQEMFLRVVFQSLYAKSALKKGRKKAS